MISIKFLRYLTVAIHCGSITEAAKQLNISASAIASAIDQIEDHFQLQLVTRNRARGIAATASGRDMVRKFQTLLDDYDAVLAEGAELKQAVTGRLRIGYYSPVAPSFLPRILESIRPAQGSLTLHLEECDNDGAQEGLLNGRFDAILFVAEGALPHVTYDVLIHAPAYCLLPAAHPLAAQSSVRLADLRQERIVLLDRPHAADYYRDLLLAADSDPRGWTTVNSTEMVRSLVGAGAGCAVLNMLPSIDVTYAGDRVVARPLRDQLRGLTLAVGYDKSRPRAVVRRFAAACQTYFAGPAAQRTIVTSPDTDRRRFSD